METTVNWTERKFDFKSSTIGLQGLSEVLSNISEHLLLEVSALKKEDLIQKDNQKWSIQEHIGHLLDLEPLWYKRAEEIIGNMDVLTPADMANDKTHKANHNSKDLSSILNLLVESRERLLQLVNRAKPEDFQKTVFHERLGVRMGLMTLLNFIQEHDRHHIDTIKSMRPKYNREKGYNKIPSSLVKIRFQDCDPHGHLNNIQYIDYFLKAREDHSNEHYGINIYDASNEIPSAWVIGKHEILYKVPANALEEVHIQSQVIDLGKRRLKLETVMFDGERTHLKAIMWSSIIHIDVHTKRSADHSAQHQNIFEKILCNIRENTIEERAIYLGQTIALEAQKS